MPSGVRDIQLLELKDTISQLNNTISTQNELIRSLQKMLQERDAKDSEKDQKPVIEAFLSWLDQLHPESGDRLIKAINYSNGCRPFMMNYLKDGACSLSNNLSENSIRPLVVGRKNWLFCDTPAGADASMKIYSMIETAKANELDPLKYLSFLLEHRPGAEMSDGELEQFAPWSKLAQETCK